MKTNPLVVLVLAALLSFVGCSSTPTPPPPPRPFVGILSAEKIGKGPRESSQYEVALYYDHVEPDKYEIKVGFGYKLPQEALKVIGNPSEGIYAIAYSEVLHSPSGDIRIKIDPSEVRRMRAKMDGKLYAILSKYPHGKEWIVVSHADFALPPE